MGGLIRETTRVARISRPQAAAGRLSLGPAAFQTPDSIQTVTAYYTAIIVNEMQFLTRGRSPSKDVGIVIRYTAPSRAEPR
jgi:hypothetical protein